MKWSNETGKTSSKTIHGIKCFVWMRIDSQMVNSQIVWNSWKKKSEIAKDLKMAAKSLKKILKEDLQYSSYLYLHVYLISAASKKKCLQKEQKLLAEILRSTDRVIIWFNQEIFTVQSVVNSQNDRIYEANVMDVQEGIRLCFVTWSQLGWWSGLLLHQMAPNHP